MAKHNLWRVCINKKTNADIFFLKDEHESYNWAHVKMDPVKNVVNTENVKS